MGEIGGSVEAMDSTTVKERCDDDLRGDGIRLFAFEMGSGWLLLQKLMRSDSRISLMDEVKIYGSWLIENTSLLATTLDRANGPICEVSIDKVNSRSAWLWDPSTWPSAAEEGPLGILVIFVRQSGELTFANSACDWEDSTMSWGVCVLMLSHREPACRSRTCVWEDSIVSRPAYLALWRCEEGVRGKNIVTEKIQLRIDGVGWSSLRQ